MAQNEILLRLKGTSDFSDIQSDVKTLQEYFKGLKLPKGITKNLEQSLEGLDKELVAFQQHMNSGFKTKGDVTGLEKSGQRIIQTFEKIQKTIDGLDTGDLKSMFSSEFNQLKEIEGKISILGKSIKKNFSGKINIGADKADKQIVDIQEALNTLYKTSTTKKFKLLQNAVDAGDIQQIRAVIKELRDYEKTSLQARVNNEGIVTREAKSNLTDFHNALETVDVIIKKIGQNPQFKMQLQDMEALKQQAAQLGITLDQKVLDVLEEMRGAVGNLPKTFENVNHSILGTAQSQQQLNSELSQVKEHITQFFSLINVAQLLRRAFQDVYNTVKELDEVMTETAVVTDFSIGDMWDKLPEYTAQAKALGVATKDLYAATTLYYQQGLDTNASMAAGVETMKMARIAGMEATQATDAMTAALRGFNMEVNETNAQNVNDVYSKLAAITASDTEEIATAMSKTAAIANSVGAEFENIAVFLAQGIETTRESADAIGTAMKTILARFNEMKKDPSEIGEIDGEIVDANKVETALRSVGIALRDTNGEFRNADQVLLEVAEKWDSMSVMQQRYIATTAAGSRQQSRFIAFMQDYNRTMELQTAAYNAEGAAQQQYEKTLESLDAKVAKLKDTWDEFILGIADSDVIKSAVDFLSGLLDIINKMTNAPGILGGVLKSLMAFGIFKGGKKVFNGFFAGGEFAKVAAKEGKSASEAFKEGFKSALKDSKGIKQASKNLLQIGSAKNADALMSYNKALKTSKELQEALQGPMAKNNNIRKVDIESIDQLIGENKRLNLTQSELLIKKQALNNLDKERNQVQVTQAAVQGLTNLELQNANNLLNEGVNSNLALIAAKKGLTLEQLKKIAVDRLGDEASKEEIKNEMEKIILSKLSVIEKAKLRIAMIKNNIVQKISTAQHWKEVSGITAKIAALITEKTSIDAVTASTIAMTAATAIAVAAIAGLVVGVVALAKWARTQTLEYKMEQAAEATKRATWAANEAKTAYEDLLSSKEEYDSFQKSLEDLTYGTLDWKKALVEANQQVLELLKTYPELAQYITRNNSGALSIDAEGWDVILNRQMQNVEKSSQGLLLRQSQEHSLNRPEYDEVVVERSTDSTDNVNEEMPSLLDWIYGALVEGMSNANSTDIHLAETVTGNNVISSTNQATANQAQTELGTAVDVNKELLEAMENGQNILDKESAIYTDLMNRTYLEADEILEYATDLMETQAKIEKFENQSAIYAQQIMQSSKAFSNLEQSDNLATVLGERFTENYDEIYAQIEPELPDDYETAVAEYAAAIGVSEDKVREQYDKASGGLKKLQKELGNLKVAEVLQQKTDEFIKAWNKLAETDQQTLGGLLSRGGEGLTEGSWEGYLNDDGTYDGEAIKEYLEGLKIDPEDFGFDDIGQMVAQIIDNLEDASKGFAQASEKLNVFYGADNQRFQGEAKTSYDNLTSGMSLANFEKFVDQLTKIGNISGVAGIEKYLKQIDTMAQKLGPEFQDKFKEIIMSIDVTSLDDIETLKARLEEVGISAEDLSDKDLLQLQSMMIQVGKATREINLEKLKNTIKSFNDISKDVKDKKSSELTFSEEDYLKLIEAGANSEDFVFNGEEYIYIGHETNHLLTLIEGHILSLIKEQKVSIDDSVAKGEKIANWMEGDSITMSSGETYTREEWVDKARNGELSLSYTQDLAKQFGITIAPDDTAETLGLKIGNHVDTYYGQTGEVYADNKGKQQQYDKQIKDVENYKTDTKVLGSNYIDAVKNETDPKKAAQAGKEYSDALKAQAKAAGLSQKAIDKYDEEIKNANGDTKKIAKATMDFVNAIEDAKTVKNLAKSFTDVNETLEKYEGNLEDVSDADIYNIAENLNLPEIEGADNFQFVKDNLDLINSAAQGSTEAMQQLQQKLAEQYGFTINANTGNVDLSSLINAQGEVEESALKALNALIEAGSYETEEVEVEQEGEYDVPIIDPATGMITGFEKKFFERGQVMTVVKPTAAPKVKQAYRTAETGGGSGSGGSGSSEKYEPDYDKYYNTIEKIEKLQDDRNALQDEYDELLEDENATLEEIQAKQEEIIANLLEEKKLQEELAAGKLAQIQQEEAENSDLSKYAWFDEKLGKVQINWDLINQVTDPEKGERIDEYIGNLENYADGYNEAIESGRDIDKEIAEYRDAGKNDLDDSFNTLEKIERIENEITNLQAERNLLMEDASENSKAILENYAKEKELLDQQLEAQKKLNEERIAQHNENLEKAQAAGVMDYIIDLGNGQFEVDQDALDQMTQAEQDFISQWVEKLNESGDAVQESTEGVNDATQAVEDFKNELQSGAFDFFDQIKEMLVADYQKKIDLLSQENEAILDAESKIFDSIQKSLDEQRQQRANEETVESIQDKEARLAYLQADTTGANDLEIMNLQKELEDQKEDYTDQLIDQKISALQQQNDEAAAQRERQIELAQAQLDYSVENGQINENVQKIINDGIGLDGKIIEGSSLYNLIKGSADYSGLTAEQQKKYWDELQASITDYLSYIGIYKTIGGDESEYKKGDDISSALGGLPAGASATVAREGVVEIDMGNGKKFSVSGVTTDMLGELDFSRVSGARYFEAKDARKILRASAKLESLSPEEMLKYDINNDGKITAADARLALRNAAQIENLDFGEDKYGEGDFFSAVGLINDKGYDKIYDLNKDGKLDDKDLELIVDNFGMPKSMFAFKTGGLADFTGPAWLDGSKSHPELVLNAQDTQNFIQLKDILSSVMKNIGSKNSDEKIGDIYYEIHIDVEKLTSDYDVDDVANRVKTIISQDAMYRNTNIINRLR